MLKVGDRVINVDETSMGYKKLYTITADNTLISVDNTFMVVDDTGFSCAFDKYKLKPYNKITKLLYLGE